MVDDVNQDHVWGATDPDREDTEASIDGARARHVDDEIVNVVGTALGRLAEGEVDHANEALRDRFESPYETRCPGVGDVPHPAACHLYKGSNEVIVAETSTDTAAEADD